MAQLIPAREGYATFRGFKTRYRVVGQSRSHPALLCIHGGPGLGHDYLRTLDTMSATGREVVYYDQLGCGASDHPETGVDWTMALFLEELESVRAAAGLEQYHLLGHGWGGMLALEHALATPAGLRSLVLSSAVASVPQWRRELAALRSELPDEIREPLQRHSDTGTLATALGRSVVDAVLRRHLCRLNPWPEVLQHALDQAKARPQVRRALFGADELEPHGALAEWDVMERLGEIRCPALVVSGRYDLVPPTSAAVLYQGIPSSEWVVFEHSAHLPHLEETQRYLEVLDGFLGKVEAGDRRGA